MLSCFVSEVERVITIQPLAPEGLQAWLATQEPRVTSWVEGTGFNAKSGEICLLANAEGQLQSVLFGVEPNDDFWLWGALPAKLPKGDYRVVSDNGAESLQLISLAWALGSYRYAAYRHQPDYEVRLLLEGSVDCASLEQLASTIYLIRDLINTPTEDMGPEQLAAAIEAVADECGAKVKQIVGPALLKQNYPTIHAVGRAAAKDREPRLVDLRWGDENAPKLTLVGKGVCFDTGGLDLKPPTAMLGMKSDMGGAAHVLGLARMIMLQQLPVCLRVLIPAVENSVSGNAYRPGDVITTRQSITVEVGNTDAEGRLVLCDALTEAVSERPDLIIDFATLTGAARVALGTDLPAFFCADNELAQRLEGASNEVSDLIWRLPLYAPYRRLLDSSIADISNCSKSRYGGAITAALFLQEFVPADLNWVHFDLMAANVKSLSGRPEGGEAQGLRAVLQFLQQRYVSEV